MKATGIVRRIDDLGRVVIPKEIRRTLHIREGDPSQITWTQSERFSLACWIWQNAAGGKSAGLSWFHASSLTYRGITYGGRYRLTSRDCIV